MKVLQGTLKEELFDLPAKNAQPGAPLRLTKETIYNADEVTYICDSIGLHRISNPSDELAVSLHCQCGPDYSHDLRLTIFSVYTTQCGKLRLLYL